MTKAGLVVLPLIGPNHQHINNIKITGMKITSLLALATLVISASNKK